MFNIYSMSQFGLAIFQVLPSHVRLVAAGRGQSRTSPSQKGPSMTLEIDPQRWPYLQGHQNRHNKKGKKKRED